MDTKGKIILSPYKIFLVGLLGFAQGVIFLIPYVMGPFYTPMLEMLECTNEQLGSLMQIYGIIMWVTLIPGGWIADRFEARKIVAIALLLSGAVGFSLSMVNNFEYFYFMWGFMSALHNLLYWSAAIKFVRIVTTPDEQGKAYGYSYAMNGLAIALVGVVSVWVFAVAGADTVRGLNNVLLLYSAMNVILGIAVWMFFKKVKTPDGGILGEEEKPVFREMLSVLRLKETWIFSIICFCLYSLQSLILSYFTPFFTDVLGMSEATAAGIYVATNFGAVLAPVIIGTFADKIGSPIRTIIIVMTAVIIILSILLVINQWIPLWAAILIDVLAVALSGGVYSIQFSAFDEIKLDRKIAGSCVAMASIIGYSSDIFIWTLFGSFLDNYGNEGYNYIFGTLLAMAVVGLAGAFVLKKWSKRNVIETLEIQG